jgi:hypothetical protein
MSLYEIYEKIAAKNPATPAAASEQKAGDLNPKGVEANYVAGGKAGKQVAGEVKQSTAPGEGYISLAGAQPAGKQKEGFVNRHAAPDGGEKGATGPDNEAMSKAAMGDKTVVGKASGDARTKGRPHLKNQGVAGVFTLTKDASMHELGVASGIKLAMDMSKAKKKMKQKASEVAEDVKDTAYRAKEKVKDMAGFENDEGRRVRGAKAFLRSTAAGTALGAAGGAAIGAAHKPSRWSSRAENARGGAALGALGGIYAGEGVGLVKQHKILKDKSLRRKEKKKKK